MKSYLELIPISARVHKRQNRMTLLCIIFAVFLVTAIFSMADMLVRMETAHTIEGHGNWHIRLKNIEESEAETISLRSDVAAASWYDTINMDMDRSYLIEGRQTVLCGIEDSFRTDIMSYLPEDSSVERDSEVILTPNAKGLLGVDAGDFVLLNTPYGDYEFQITGFRSDDSQYVNSNGGEDTALLVKGEQIGAFINIAAFDRIVDDNHETSCPSYYIRFKKHADIKKAIAQISEQCGLADGDMEQNTILMSMMGVSNNSIIQNIYPLILMLFLMILLAGILMISGSLNSNIAKRTQFFGMMRCIGMSRQQVIRFVRLEALSWCRVAVPAGVALGTVISWALCAVLRYFVRGEFAELSVFGISAVGIISGALLGILTVLLSAQSPARRAARVSPAAAVSGGMDNTKKIRRGANTSIWKIETSLGISHAVAAKKNLFLMAGSFALSIILFLCFSVLVELLGYMLPTKADAPNLSISSSDNSNSIERELVETLKGMGGIKHAFGRMYEGDIPAEFWVETEQTTVELISYDELQLDWLVENDDLKKGSDLSKVYGDNGYALAIWDENMPLEIGDKVRLNGSEVKIAGMLRYNPFSNSGGTEGEIILICSNETFFALTGQKDYAIIDMQVARDATEEEVAAVRSLVDGRYEFLDRREEADRSTFYAFSLFIYGFLVIIALITVLNIVNSISMGVSARVKQYGAMRAVGMDGGQLTRMIAAEAAIYAFTGSIIGCAAGLALGKYMYDKLITAHFPYYTWSVPVQPLLIILLFVIAATAAAVYGPAKRMRDMAVTETINEL